MKRIKLLIFFFFFIEIFIFSQTASFYIPDTVCVNQNIIIQNTSTGGSSYYWNFCSGNLSTTPIGLNMGNLGSLNRPVYSVIAKDGNNYYVFITNNFDGTLTRLSFGNSLINTPVATNLGTLGVLGIYTEGIQIKKDSISGNWIGLIAWGQTNCVARLNFGNSLANTPVVTNLGNISNILNYPHTIYTFKEGTDWFSLVGNYNNSTLIRLSFGNSLTNTPTAISLGNIGSLNGPVGFYPVNENGVWYLFLVNKTNSTLSRLNFGSSLLNIPIGVNLGNINNSLNNPRSITVVRDCGKIFGFVVNETTNDIVRLTFPNGILSSPTGISLGNIASFDFPHHISELFRVGDSLYTFIMNVNNHTISRLCFTNCNNSSIPSSNLQNPPTISYNTPGTYNINLVVNEGLATQSNMCKEIVVVGGINVHLGNDTTICLGNTLNLNAGNPGCTYAWNTGQSSQTIIVTTPGTYVVIVTKAGGCIGKDTINVNFSNLINVNIGNDTTICPGGNVSLNAGNPGYTYNWNTGQSSQIINVTSTGTYIVTVTNSGGCIGKDTINVNFSNPLTVHLGNDTTICLGNSFSLYAGNPGCSYSWSTGQTSQSINITTSGTYSVTVTNPGGCIRKDTININISSTLPVNLGSDTIICQGNSLVLNAGNPGSTYFWNAGQNTQYITVSAAGKYWVNVNNNGCKGNDTIQITTVPKPLITLGNDTLICPGDLILLLPGSGFSSYLWSTGAVTSSLIVTQPGMYSVIVTDGPCDASDEILIDECGSEIWVPNVFTPNGDGINDFFFPVCTNIDKIKMYVYNRWGNQIFEGSAKAIIWDGKYYGKLCADGVYYYLIEYESKGINKGSKQKHGSVTLLR